MSTTIPNAHVEAFRATVLFTAQQRGSRLRGTLIEEDVIGKQGNAERIGSVNMQQKTARHADVPLISTPHSRRRVPIKDWQIRDLEDDEDRLKVIINAQTAYATAFGYAAGRKYDEEILAGLVGTAIDGDGASVLFDAGNSPSLDLGGAAAVLDVGMLVDAKTRMIENGVDPMETLHIAIGGAGMRDLMYGTASPFVAGVPTIVNSDYAGFKALQEGSIHDFMGFRWHILHDALLPAVAASTDQYIVVYSEFGGQLGNQKNASVKIERIPEKNAEQILLTSSFGVVRTDEARVARIRIAT